MAKYAEKIDNMDSAKVEHVQIEEISDVSHLKIIETVTENHDPFTWVELNCFYKPMAILLASYNRDYFDFLLFYVSYYSNYMADGWFSGVFEKEESSFHLFFQFYENILKNKFGLSIRKVDILDEKELVNQIKNEVDKGYPVLIPGDLIGLSYSEMFMDEHHMHYFAIKGYNLKRKLFYILDNMHLESGSSTIYKDFSMEFEKLYPMVKEYFMYYFPDIKNPHFWVVEPLVDKFALSYLDVLYDYYNQLKGLKSGKSKIHYYIQEVVKEIQSHGNAERCRSALADVNFKAVYYYYLYILLKKAGISRDKINKISDLEKIIQDHWTRSRKISLICLI